MLGTEMNIDPDNLLLARVYVNLPEGKWKNCDNLPGNMAIWYIYIYIHSVYIYRGKDWKMMINDLVVPIFRQPRFKLCLLSHGTSKKYRWKFVIVVMKKPMPLLLISIHCWSPRPGKVGRGTLSVWWSTRCKTSLRLGHGANLYA